MSSYGMFPGETPEIEPMLGSHTLPPEILWGRSYRLEDPALPGIRLYTFTDINRMMEHLFAVRRGRSFTAPSLADVRNSWERACRLGSEHQALPTVAAAAGPSRPSKSMVKPWHWRVVAMLMLLVLGSLCGFLLVISSLDDVAASENGTAGKPVPRTRSKPSSTIECANPQEVSPAVVERSPAGVY
jgi:hypothetical protein